MTRSIPVLPLVAAVALSGCTGNRPLETVLHAAVRDSCWAELAQPTIGQQASVDAGVRLLHDTGSRELRWAPPRVRAGADSKYGRITVSYDETMRITRVSCG